MTAFGSLVKGFADYLGGNGIAVALQLVQCRAWEAAYHLLEVLNDFGKT